MLNADKTCVTISRGAGSRAGDGCQSASSPGNTSASTANSADITIVLFTRPDLTTYDELRTLGVAGWTKQPFCAATTHAT